MTDTGLLLRKEVEGSSCEYVVCFFTDWKYFGGSGRKTLNVRLQRFNRALLIFSNQTPRKPWQQHRQVF